MAGAAHGRGMLAARGHVLASRRLPHGRATPEPQLYLQRDQPDGRPAAGAHRRAHAARRARGELLVPRHLVVYEWIARRASAGCGRRHGLRRGLRRRRARRAARRRSSASTPTPRPTSTRGCATRAPNLRFARDLVETFAEPCRRRRVPADDRARRRTRTRCSSTSRRMLGRQRRAGRDRLDAQRADARARGRREVRQPVARQGVPARGVPRAVRARTSPTVELLGLFHARKLRVHELAHRARCAGTTSTRGCGITKRFYDRFTPAISVARLRADAPTGRSTARWTSWPSAGRERRRGRARARPAHPHALRRGLRDVAVRRGVAVRGGGDVVPAAAGRCSTSARRRRSRCRSRRCSPTSSRRPASRERCSRFLRDAAPRRRTRSTPRAAARAASRALAAEVERAGGDYARAADALRRARRRRPARARSRAHAAWTSQRHPRRPAARGHRRRRAPAAARRDRGPPRARAARRGRGGFWLPECAHAPWLTRCSRRPASTRRASTSPTSSARRASTRRWPPTTGRCWCRSTARSIELVWSDGGYPAARRLPRLRTARPSTTTTRGPTTAPSTTATARASRPRADAARLRGARRASASPAAGCASARWTPSCSATTGTRAWTGWPRCSTRRARAGLELVAPRRRAAPTRRSRPARRASCRPTSWGTPRDAVDVGRPAGRRPRLRRRARRAARRRRGRRAPDARAVRELLALQSSDWAFLATRDLAGPYPRERAAGHLAALDAALAAPRRARSRRCARLAPFADPAMLRVPVTRSGLTPSVRRTRRSPHATPAARSSRSRSTSAHARCDGSGPASSGWASRARGSGSGGASTRRSPALSTGAEASERGVIDAADRSIDCRRASRRAPGAAARDARRAPTRDACRRSPRRPTALPRSLAPATVEPGPRHLALIARSPAMALDGDADVAPALDRSASRSSGAGRLRPSAATRGAVAHAQHARRARRRRPRWPGRPW